MPQICAANCTIEHGKSSKGLPWNTKPHKESSRPDRSTVDFSKLKRTPQKIHHLLQLQTNRVVEGTVHLG